MKAQKVFKLIFGRVPEMHEENDVTYIRNYSDSLIIECRGMSRELFTEDNDVNDEDGNFMFSVEDLQDLGNFNEFNECQDCYGEGYVEMFKECFKPASQCCGGCTETIACNCENKHFIL